ncbi:uncharacterized protein LOC126974010 isoform X1 [Leptidea sinapis]|uniref:uncharacterized protein LOC126974010 isoform X1 n=1 Tax=Leptidea sinapis TaxID=189913 RepID=UPI0021C368E4|nr:uncharacterized protein LOC126974010 isoform X1 [Leptidea sinapis]XP_050677325.1 uncharacterized protein LOC126974010 isoform X1 [Leptidea sinapis]
METQQRHKEVVLVGDDVTGARESLAATEDLFRPLVLNHYKVFASSLLSLISPWARSPAAGLCRLPARYPRPLALPPPPRRHSDPTDTDKHTNTPHNKRRRYSEVKQSQIDLRQELVNLNLNKLEVDNWLGSKFDEGDEDAEFELDFRFSHDIPLQRSISLDRGLDIVNYLQTLGSDWSLSEVTSSESFIWMVDSESNGLRFEQYRSFEDIPAPSKVKNRHVSLDVTNSMLGNSVALSVLRESYKGIEVDDTNLSPQIRKLQKTFSFKNFDDYRDSTKTSAENLNFTYDDTNVVKPPLYRNTSVDKQDIPHDKVKTVRQRRFGVTANAWHQNSYIDLRKEVLVRQNIKEARSFNDLMENNTKSERKTESDMKHMKLKLDSYNISSENISKLKRSFSKMAPKIIHGSKPAIVVENIDQFKTNNVEISNQVEYSPNLVEVATHCDCRICCEKADQNSFFGDRIKCLFIKIISFINYARKSYWDENNNLNKSEMYTCIMQLLKFLFGLWLRHCGHNRAEVVTN